MFFKKNSKKRFVFGIIVIVIVAGIQFIAPGIENPPATGMIKAPPAVLVIFQRACFDCHSNQTKLRWYNKIAPVSLLVAADVKEARSRFNFSDWNSLSYWKISSLQL